MLKRPPRSRHGKQFLAFFCQPAFRQEFGWAGPECGIVLTGVGDEPDEHFRGSRVAETVAGIGDCEIWFAATGCRGGGEEAHAFFDGGGGVGEFVQEMRGVGDYGCCICSVGAEDAIVFGAEEGEDVGVSGEEVEDVADGATCSVVAREEEEFHLVDGDGFEGWVDGAA